MADIKTPVGNAPVIPVILIISGFYLAWFGIHYWATDIKYPSTPVKDILQGKGVTPATGRSPSVSAVLSADVQGLQPDSGATGSEQQASATGTGAVTSNKGGTPAQNINLGRLLAGTYGWAGNDEFPYLQSGWQEESGWSTTAAYSKSDPYNNAYGIPQANPGTKMASAGPNWKTDAATQITWGLIYIKQTYGSPSKVPHWSPNGPTAGYVGY